MSSFLFLLAFKLSRCSIPTRKLARQSPLSFLRGGKSGLRRVKCQVTPGGREPTESATEKIPPKQFTAGKVEMVR